MEPIAENNPKGFFEDIITNQLDEAFLKDINCRWDLIVLPTDIAPQVVTTYQKNINEMVFKRFEDKQLWGLKDPRISRLWRFWLPVFAETGIEPVFVLANRHPFSVASSLAKRDRMPEAHALALWAVHQLDSLEALLQQGGLVVDYDLVMKEPRHELQRIASFLGTADRLAQDEIDGFECDFLAHELRHSHYLHESATSTLQNLCLDLHAGLLELAQLPGGLDDKHIGQARNLVTKCRSELAKSIDWMQAIDDLQTARFNDSSGKVESETLIECEARLYISEIVEGVPQSYSESRGAATLYPISKQRQTICLLLPAALEPLARIRLDPANCPVGLLFHSLVVLQADGAEAWHWDGSRALFRNSLGLILRDTAQGLMVVCLNDDPQFDLAIPTEVLAQIRGGASLVVDMTPRPILDALPGLLAQAETIKDLPAPVQNSMVVPIGMSRQLVEVAQLMKDQIIRRNEKIASQRGEIESMQSQQRQLEEHVLRAEAQLELLKEFFLATGQRSERL